MNNLVLSISLFSIVFTYIVSCAIRKYDEASDERGVRFIVFGLTIHICSYALVSFIAQDVRFGIASAVSVLFCLGLSCFAQGLSRFAAIRLPWAVIWLPPFIIVLTIPLIGADDAFRVAFRSLVLLIPLVSAAWFLSGPVLKAPGAGKYALMTGFFILSGGLVARIIYVSVVGAPLIAVAPAETFGESGNFSPRHLLALFLMLFGSTAIAVGALVMVKDRLRFQAAKASSVVQGILDSIPSQLCVVDTKGVITAVNEAWKQFATENEAPSNDWVGVDYLGVCAPTSSYAGGDGFGAVAHGGIRDVLDGRQSSFCMEYPCHSPDRNRWFLMSVSPLTRGDEGAVIVHTDITERREIEALRERSVALFDKMSRMVPGIIFKLVRLCRDRYRFEYISPNVAEKGVRPSDLTRDAEPLFALVHPSDLDDVKASLLNSEAELDLWRVQFRWRQPDGSYRWQEAQAKPEREGDDRLVWYGHIADVQEQKNTEEQIRVMAQHDTLTGLPNRALFNDRLTAALAVARRESSSLALLFIDLDKFKPVNDSFGHDVGDLLLTEVALRLQGKLRSADTPARIGGDEFVVLLHKVRGEADARRVAEGIGTVLSAPYVVKGHVLEISVSIGLAVYPLHGNDSIALIRHADQAMYRAKQDRKARERVIADAVGLDA